MSKKDQGRALSVAEAARELGFSREKAYKIVKKTGIGSTGKEGKGKYRISPEDLSRLREEGINTYRPPKGTMPSKEELLEFYVKRGLGVRETAKMLGCSKDRVFSGLKKYGIERRSRDWAPGKKSKLWRYEITELRRLVEAEGLNRAAKSLSVDRRTLRKHIE